MKRCDICGNERVIRLPVRRPLSTMPEPYRDTMIVSQSAETLRTFPCPACAQVTDFGHVAIMTASVDYAADSDLIGDPTYVEHVRNGAAHDLVELLVKSDNVEHRSDVPQPSRFFGRVSRMRASIGVVSKNFVASLEDRITERQMMVADEVVKEAAAQIRQWGSLYSGLEGNISKGQAVDAVQRALRTIQERHKRRA